MRWNFRLSFILALLSPACGNVPNTYTPPVKSSSARDTAQQIVNASVGVRTHFSTKDYFTLDAPYRNTDCAGDAKNYYDPMQTTGSATPLPSPSPFPLDTADNYITLKPTFVKNISVDLTDANSPKASNAAYSCSFLDRTWVPQASNCASFDSGLITGGVNGLAGTLVLFGGTKTSNFSGIYSSSYLSSLNLGKGLSLSCGPARPYYSDLYASTNLKNSNTGLYDGLTSCFSGMHALGQDPASTWISLSSASGYSGPPATAGSTLSYSADLQRLILTTGSIAIDTFTGQDTTHTWKFDLKSQKWTQMKSTASSTTAMTTMKDTNGSTTYQLAHIPQVRSSFGYAAIPFTSVNSLTANGLINNNMDATERIFILGGANGGNSGTSAFDLGSVRKFNPTFGPEYLDLVSGTAVATIGSSDPSQWINSYHTQLLSNNYSTNPSVFKPTYITSTPTATSAIDFGFISIVDLSQTSPIGFSLTAGGFSTGGTTNSPATTNQGGTLLYSNRRSYPTTNVSEFIATPNAISGPEQFPLQWSSYTESTDPKSIPWYGGGVLLRGFSLSSNDLVYFGGSYCPNYALSPTGCNFNNPGRYISLSNNPFARTNLADNFSTDPIGTPPGIAALTSPPQRAGMAAARGLDPSGNPIIVAWGGISDPAPTSPTNIFVLYKNGSTPTWQSFPPLTSSPLFAVGSAFVFSHVTRKFYLFGGYSPNTPIGPVGDTWELTLSGTPGNYQASWKQLNTSTDGLTCNNSESSTTNSCPQARYFHRMLEVNYHYGPTGNVDTSTWEPKCDSAANPCSFGIFMEGGTTGTPASGTLSNHLSDRWMFDPTANGGRGHWQLVNDFPPRHFAAAAPIEYQAKNSKEKLHRILLFGGEGGMSSPAMAVQGNYFVPPTFGDTYLFDIDSNQWGRVQLLGKGYKDTGTINNLSEFEKRQSYLLSGGSFYRSTAINTATPDAITSTAVDPNIAVLTPPPLAGAIMVTRTMSDSSVGATNPIKPLLIPEVFLMGGRTKDGKYHSLGQVYKFCAGSTGERIPNTSNNLDDAACDAYDGDNGTNLQSPSPIADFVGRWIKKTPPTGTATAYLAAGTYDSYRDRIIVFGGITGTTAVTDSSNYSVSNVLYEYTPPKKTVTTDANELNGSWATISACSGSTAPTLHGHTLVYDNINRQLILSGGFNSSGTAQSDVWTAKRDDSNSCYTWTKKSGILAGDTKTPQSALGHSAAVFIPAHGYSTGYYSLFDQSCTGAGPTGSSDPTEAKSYAGGAYIDLDRTGLKENENLLLHLTYIPLGIDNQKTDGSSYTSAESAYFKIHLQKINQPWISLLSAIQPRYFGYSSTDPYYSTVDTLSVLAPPTGTLRQDQIFIPLSMDSKIDRIRIQRQTGSAILIDVALYRLGSRGVQ